METVFNSGLVAIGGFTVLFYFLKFSWKFWCGVRVYVLSEYWKTDLRKYGQWAVVTGATSGIGRAYADELAKRGLDILLISRSEEKLHTVAREIERLHGRKTRVIQADFTEGHAIYPAIAEGLHNLDIGILVNNVGMNYVGTLRFFLDVSSAEKRITDVINCNILSVTQMTRLVLPHMVEKCLNTEYSSQGVTVQCVAPFTVSTNMTQNMTVNAFVKSAPDYAYEALNTVGHSSHTSGCLSHALQHVALNIFFPGWLRLSPFCVRQMEKICNRRREHYDNIQEGELTIKKKQP